MPENNTALAGITVGVIGAGSMGGAIARGLVEAGAIEGSRVLVCDHNASKLEALAAEAGGESSAAIRTRVTAARKVFIDEFIAENLFKPYIRRHRRFEFAVFSRKRNAFYLFL